MNKSLQAKDLEDSVFLEFIRLKSQDRAKEWGFKHPAPTMVWDFPEGIPIKIVLAKASALIKRGLIEGCTCGCRGDFLLTLAGEKYLEETLNDSTN